MLVKELQRTLVGVMWVGVWEVGGCSDRGLVKGNEGFWNLCIKRKWGGGGGRGGSVGIWVGSKQPQQTFSSVYS